MARPTPFTRQTSFTQFSSNYPSKPQNGASLDAEFNAAKVALDETQSNLALIQDDDGRLARGSVGRAQFDSSIILGFDSPTPWAVDTQYTAFLSTVWYGGKFYTATEDHTSSDTFDADKWFEVADLSASAAIEDGSITEAKLASSAVTAEKIGALAVTTPKIASQAVTNSKLATGAVTRTKVDDSAGPDLAALILPAGLGPIPWPLAGDAPPGWIFDGGTYDREDYPVLAALAVADAANPTSWFTAGDGSTTFTIKSAEGCALVGVDADGSTVGSALALGAQIGAKNKSILKANLPNTTFTFVGNEGGVDVTGNETGVPFGCSTSGFTNIGGGGNPAVPNLGSISTPTAHGVFTPTGTVSSGGSGTPLDVIQPSVGVRFMFKAH